MKWRNWAGTAACEPSAVRAPAGVDELAALVRDAASRGRRVKAAGAGHSFTGIACTDGMMLRLDRLDRILAVDRARRTVTVEAGIRLGALCERLAGHGLALANMGDVAVQSLAGAIATATHGTGAGSGTLSSQVVALSLVLADGRTIRCDPAADPEVFRAAQTGLGALGVAATVTLQCADAFTLHAIEEPMPLDECLSRLDEMVAADEHFEFFWFPHTPRVLVKRNNRTGDPPRPRSRPRAFIDDVLLANHLFGFACRAGRMRPALIPPVARLVAGALSRREYSDRSDRVFASPRRVRFAEMEYAIPRAAAADAVRAVRTTIDAGGHRISFPVEVRFAAAEDPFLSPAHGRDTCYVAVHVYRGMPYQAYFRAVETIMRDLDGRPHWGKIHDRDAAALRPLYPAWDRFQAVRRRLDPDGVFRNDYLDRVLGVG